MPDLLVRGDVLERLFPGVYALELERQSDEEGCAPDAPALLAAPRLGGTHHYRVVDIKFTGLHLAASGEVGNGGSGLAYKAQLFLYNRALGSAQGIIPPAAFLLGRSWEQGEDGGRGCFERLAPRWPMRQTPPSRGCVACGKTAHTGRSTRSPASPSSART